MRTIWKVTLDLLDKQTIEVPRGALFLCAQMQRNLLVVWFECDSGEAKVPVEIRIIGTGHQFDDHERYSYLGTVQTNEGDFVWHVFLNFV